MFRLRGFSIIELMIVVAIIAILSAVAYPAYQDYVIRSQVAEGASLATVVKVSVSDYYYNKGIAPASNGEAHLPIATDIRGRHVLRVDVSNGGVISVTYGNRANQALASRKLVLLPMFGVGSTEWRCSSSDIDPRWLPVACR